MKTSYREEFAVRRAALLAFVGSLGMRADVSDRIIVEHRARQEELLAMSTGILDLADRETRELTAQEQQDLAEQQDEHDRLEHQISLRERVIAQQNQLNASRGRQVDGGTADPNTQALDTGNAGGDGGGQSDGGTQSTQQIRNSGRGGTQSRPTQGVQTRGLQQPGHAAARHGNFGFPSLGIFAQCVRHAIVNRVVDPRLLAAATTYGSEGVGSDGGFAVPPDFRQGIQDLVTAEGTLFSLTDNSPTDSNMVVMQVDETSAYGTFGVQVYSRAEAGVMTQSKPKLKDHVTKVNEIYAFVPMTDELLSDAPLLASHLTKKAGEAFNFKLNDYIVNGNGIGQPLGILNSGALVKQAIESGQTLAIGGIHADNIANMWSRMPADCRSRAVWLINQDAEPLLMKLGFTVHPAGSATATGGIPLYIPPGGLSAAPYATLLGRPVIPTEACAAIGTVGDIILFYGGGYFMPFKSGGIRSDISMHLFFDQGLTCFRWTFRLGGQPWLSAPIARKVSSLTLSHFIALDVRT